MCGDRHTLRSIVKKKRLNNPYKYQKDSSFLLNRLHYCSGTSSGVFPGKTPCLDTTSSGVFPGKTPRNEPTYPGVFPGKTPRVDTTSFGVFPGKTPRHEPTYPGVFPGKTPRLDTTSSGVFPGKTPRQLRPISSLASFPERRQRGLAFPTVKVRTYMVSLSRQRNSNAGF